MKSWGVVGFIVYITDNLNQFKKILSPLERVKLSTKQFILSRHILSVLLHYTLWSLTSKLVSWLRKCHLISYHKFNKNDFSSLPHAWINADTVIILLQSVYHSLVNMLTEDDATRHCIVSNAVIKSVVKFFLFLFACFVIYYVCYHDLVK